MRSVWCTVFHPVYVLFVFFWLMCIRLSVSVQLLAANGSVLTWLNVVWIRQAASELSLSFSFLRLHSPPTLHVFLRSVIKHFAAKMLYRQYVIISSSLFVIPTWQQCLTPPVFVARNIYLPQNNYFHNLCSKCFFVEILNFCEENARST